MESVVAVMTFIILPLGGGIVGYLWGYRRALGRPLKLKHLRKEVIYKITGTGPFCMILQDEGGKLWFTEAPHLPGFNLQDEVEIVTDENGKLRVIHARGY